MTAAAATHWNQLMSAATVASIRRWLLLGKLKDLELHAAGDTNRFDRMVGSKGESLGSAEEWRKSVKRLLEDELIREHCPGDLAIARRRAMALGIVEPPGGEVDGV